MKLSDYAKKAGISYRTAYNRFRAGVISGYQLTTGTIVITEPDPDLDQLLFNVYKILKQRYEGQENEVEAV